MTDIATLQIKIDASQAKPAVDDLNRLGKAAGSAEGMVNSAGKTWVKASSDAGRLRMESKGAAAALDDVGRAARNAEAGTVQIGKAARAAGANMDVVTASAGAQKAGMQQLGYQLGDIATMWAGGAKPATIFATQIGQVTQAITLLSGGTSRLAGFLGGPWGMAISTAAIVLSPFISKLFESSNAADTAADSFRNAAAAARELAGAENSMKLMQAQMSLNEKSSRRLELENQIASRPKDARGNPMFSYKDQKELQGLRQEMLRDNSIIKLAEQQNADLAKSKEKVVKATTSHATASRAARPAISAEAKAVNQAMEESKRYADSLEEQVSKLGKTTLEIHRMEIAAKAAAAPTKELAQRIRDYGAAIEANMIKQATDEYEKLVKRYEDENSLLGLIGPAREKAALALEEEAFKADLAAKGITNLEERWQAYLRVRTEGIDKKTAFENDAKQAEILNDQLRDMINLLQGIGGIGNVLGGALGFLTGDYGSVGGSIGGLLNTVTGFQTDKNGEKVAIRLGDELRDVFGLGGEFGNTLTETFKNAGIGVLASDAILGAKGSKTGAAIGGAIGKEIGKSFGKEFGVIGNVVGGVLGGLVGGMFKKAKKGVATFGGDGSEFDIVTSGNSDKRIQAANAAADNIIEAMKGIADKLNGSIDAALASVSIGIRNKKYVVDPTGKGRTKGSGVLKFDTEEEAVAAAIKDMINDGVIKGLRAGTEALLKGTGDLETQLQKALDFENVFRSLEASTNPLKAALDQIQQEFEHLSEVFREAGATAAEYAQLEEYIAKQRAAAIDSASANYRSNFYTTAENEAYARQQIDAQTQALGYGTGMTVDQYKAAVESVDKTTEEGMKKYGELLALSDEFATLQQAQQEREQQAAQAAADALNLANQKRTMEIELLRLTGKETEALTAQRALEREQLDSSLQSLYDQIAKAQDIADAKDVLRDAYERESSALQTTIDKFDAFGKSLRDFRDSLYAGGTSQMSYNQSLAKLMQTGALAGAGNEAALGDLPTVGKDFLDVAKSRASSMQDYQRSIALVARYVDGAIGGADSKKSVAQQQLDQMKTQVGALIDINESVITVAQAIEKLNALIAAPAGGGGVGPGIPGLPTFNIPMIDVAAMLERIRNGQPAIDVAALNEQFASLRVDMAATNRNTDKFSRLLDRLSSDGETLNVTVVTP